MTACGDRFGVRQEIESREHSRGRSPQQPEQLAAGKAIEHELDGKRREFSLGHDRTPVRANSCPGGAKPAPERAPEPARRKYFGAVYGDQDPGTSMGQGSGPSTRPGGVRQLPGTAPTATNRIASAAVTPAASSRSTTCWPAPGVML